MAESIYTGAVPDAKSLEAICSRRNENCDFAFGNQLCDWMPPIKFAASQPIQWTRLDVRESRDPELEKALELISSDFNDN